MDDGKIYLRDPSKEGPEKHEYWELQAIEQAKEQAKRWLANEQCKQVTIRTKHLPHPDEDDGFLWPAEETILVTRDPDGKLDFKTDIPYNDKVRERNKRRWTVRE